MAHLALDNVHLQYPIFTDGGLSMRRALAGLLRQAYRPECKSVDALRGISIALDEGDRLGLIGPNGAGKSTLLRVCADIYLPTRGVVTRSGRISTLFDLYLGMDDEASGLENIRIAGLTLGFEETTIRAMTDEVAQFTELGEALFRPLRTFSTGMRVRLAFAIATAQLGGIVLIDEIIGVGDARFLQKASRRFAEALTDASIVVIASHAPQVLRDFCTKGAVMADGEIRYLGTIDDALAFYNGTLSP